MRRRKFIQLVSLSPLCIGYLAYLTVSNKLVNIFPSVCQYNYGTMENLHLSKQHILFSKGKALEKVATIISEKQNWGIIERPFSNDFYRESEKKFFKYAAPEREILIIQYIKTITIHVCVVLKPMPNILRGSEGRWYI